MGRIVAHGATTQDHHAARLHARYATQQYTAAAVGFLHGGGARLNAHPPGHLGHGGEQGQAATRGGDRFVGDGSDAAGDELFGLARVGRQVQISEQKVVGFEAGAFVAEGLLDLDDHDGLLEDLLGAQGDAGTCAFVIAVAGTDTVTRTRFDPHLVSVGHHFPDSAGRQADPIFVVLCFPGNADLHVLLHVRGPYSVRVAGCKPGSNNGAGLEIL